MRALVTGGAGFIGSTLVDRLLAEGHAVDVVDDLSSGSLANLAAARADRAHEFTFHQIDVREPRPHRPDGPAPARGGVPPGRPGRRAGVGRPARSSTPRSTCSAACTCSRGPVRRAAARWSSPRAAGTIYGEPEPADLPVERVHPQRPLSPYGVAKKVVGDYLYAYRELHNLEYTALALANVYGPRQDPHGEAGVVAIFAGRLLAGEPCTIFGDGGQTRDFVYVDDVVDAFVRAAERGQRPAAQHRHRGRDVGQRAVRRDGATRPGSTAPAVHAPARPGRAAALGLDPGRAGHPPGLEAVDDARRGHRRRARLVPRPRRPIGEPVGPPDLSGTDPRSGGGRSRRGPDDSRSHAGSTPRTTATGMPLGLAHHQLGGGGDLVGHAHLGDLQLPAERVGRAPQVDHGGDAGRRRWPRRSRRAARSARRCRDTITPTSTPARARRPSRMRRAERSESTGSRAA